MGQSVENKCSVDSATLELFRSKVEQMSGTSAVGYRKAFACLCDYVWQHAETAGISSTFFVTNWVVSMYWRGFTEKTVLHYLDLISSLYSSAVKAGELPATDAFKSVKAKIRRLSPEMGRPGITEESFARFARFTKLAGRRDDETALFADILLFALINKGMRIAEAAVLKCDDLPRYGDESRAIAQKYLDPRRRYVFPLRQSYRTGRQIEMHATMKVARLLLSHNIALAGSVEETLRSYWAYAALKTGAAATSVVGALGGVPEGLPVLRLCADEAPATADVAADVARMVTGLFLSDPVGWYAMRLRPGVKYDTLVARLSELKGQVATPELFYPMEEIARRVGKKLLYKEVPVLPGILFFRSRLTDIQPLFARIGEWAWCYKTGNTYSAISEWEMSRFRQAIGAFTPETDIVPSGTVALQKDDRVVILGGIFAGQSATFHSEQKEGNAPGAGRTIYRLLLSSDNGIEWAVKLDPRLVKKISDN